MIQYRKSFNCLKPVKGGGISSEEEFQVILEEGSDCIFIFILIVGIVLEHGDHFSSSTLHNSCTK